MKMWRKKLSIKEIAKQFDVSEEEIKDRINGLRISDDPST